MCMMFHFVLLMSNYKIHVTYLPTSFRFALLALGQSYDCPSASEVNLENMGKTNQYQTTANHNKA